MILRSSTLSLYDAGNFLPGSLRLDVFEGPGVARSIHETEQQLHGLRYIPILAITANILAIITAAA